MADTKSENKSLIRPTALENHPFNTSVLIYLFDNTIVQSIFNIYKMRSREAALVMLLAITIQAASAAMPFTANYLATTDTFHTRILNAGERVDLVLDKSSGAFKKHMQNTHC